MVTSYCPFGCSPDECHPCQLCDECIADMDRPMRRIRWLFDIKRWMDSFK